MTGSRIRERRLDLGLRQAKLAEICGISASYLNLIEHNRRRIGGKLLNDLADALGVEAAALAEGVDTGLLDGLGDAAARSGREDIETERAEELSGRFPGWAGLIAAQARKIDALERLVETLNDRLTHDPQLATSLHDVLSTVTAIRSSSAILVDDADLDSEWRVRFNRNIHEDSRRLADAAEGLVRYLDQGSDAARSFAAPQEELEAWLEERGFHMPELERSIPLSPKQILEGAEALGSAAARELAVAHLERYRRDAERMPVAPFLEAFEQLGPDPAQLAARFGADITAVFRRLAALPEDGARERIGLAVCDASGTLTFRKTIDGFPLPRFGAACPLLPLYQALVRPMSPVRAMVEMPGRTPRRFLTYAIAQPAHPAGFDGPTVFEAAMLMLPEDPEDRSAAEPTLIGTSCRICPRAECPARREPSILADGA